MPSKTQLAPLERLWADVTDFVKRCRVRNCCVTPTAMELLTQRLSLAVADEPAAVREAAHERLRQLCDLPALEPTPATAVKRVRVPPNPRRPVRPTGGDVTNPAPS